MPELILFSFIALLIGGMLWSDRDSRRLRYGEFVTMYLKLMADATGLTVEHLTGHPLMPERPQDEN